MVVFLDLQENLINDAIIILEEVNSNTTETLSSLKKNKKIGRTSY